jgi:hypothetical protein
LLYEYVYLVHINIILVYIFNIFIYLYICITKANTNLLSESSVSSSTKVSFIPQIESNIGLHDTASNEKTSKVDSLNLRKKYYRQDFQYESTSSLINRKRTVLPDTQCSCGMLCNLKGNNLKPCRKNGCTIFLLYQCKWDKCQEHK